jgi:hypothetical protein
MRSIHPLHLGQAVSVRRPTGLPISFLALGRVPRLVVSVLIPFLG